MSARTIIVGVDGSPNADKAFTWTLDNLIQKDDTIIVVHCPEISIPFSMQEAVAIADAVSAEHTKVDNLIAKYAEKLKKRGVVGKAIRADGQKPGEAIIAAAISSNASMIVTGTRGLGTFRRTILGSVSDYIVKHASIPVTVYKDSE